MKLSLDWMSDFADIRGVQLETLAATANEIGLEIGTVEAFSENGVSDTIFDADVTPNRPDAMNHRGFARDLAAALSLAFDGGRCLDAPEEGGEPIGAHASVTIEVPDRCHRFALKAVRGAGARPSSEKWRRRLTAIDVKSIDAAVDATNISLWGLGQPLHAFDADKVAGGALVVRLARRGERLVCLDGVERELHPEDVVVADERKALSIAGVIGGLESAITPGATKNILLEAAWWDPVSIRRTARRHGLHTDASHRYERGADIEAIPDGLALATRLILETAGGRASRGTIDAYPRRFAPRTATLRHARLLALSGLRELSLGRAAEILERLGFGVEIRGDSLKARIPSWRPDVALEEDLIEEVVRIEGYSKIPFELPAAERLSPLYLGSDPADDRAPRETEDRVADAARESGLFEAMNFPFAAAEEGARFGNLLGKSEFRLEPLVVTNPLDATRPHLRRLLLPALLDAAARNHRNGLRSIALFEIGRVWDRPVALAADPAAIESRHFAAVLAGFAGGEYPPRPADVLDAKGMIRRVLLSATGEEPDFLPAGGAFFAGGSGLDVLVGGASVGVLGKLPESVRVTSGTPPGAIVAELDFGVLDPRRSVVRFRDYSRFPSADLDMTIPCGPGVQWRDVEQSVDGAELAHLEEVLLLKIYEDPARPGLRHLSFRLVFRASDRTLSQEEVNRERDRLFEVLKQKFGEQK